MGPQATTTPFCHPKLTPQQFRKRLLGKRTGKPQETQTTWLLWLALPSFWESTSASNTAGLLCFFPSNQSPSLNLVQCRVVHSCTRRWGQSFPTPHFLLLYGLLLVFSELKHFLPSHPLLPLLRVHFASASRPPGLPNSMVSRTSSRQRPTCLMRISCGCKGDVKTSVIHLKAWTKESGFSETKKTQLYNHSFISTVVSL